MIGHQPVKEPTGQISDLAIVVGKPLIFFFCHWVVGARQNRVAAPVAEADLTVAASISEVLVELRLSEGLEEFLSPCGHPIQQLTIGWPSSPRHCSGVFDGGIVIPHPLRKYVFSICPVDVNRD